MVFLRPAVIFLFIRLEALHRIEVVFRRLFQFFIPLHRFFKNRKAPVGFLHRLFGMEKQHIGAFDFIQMFFILFRLFLQFLQFFFDFPCLLFQASCSIERLFRALGENGMFGVSRKAFHALVQKRFHLCDFPLGIRMFQGLILHRRLVLLFLRLFQIRFRILKLVEEMDHIFGSGDPAGVFFDLALNRFDLGSPGGFCGLILTDHRPDEFFRLVHILGVLRFLEMFKQLSAGEVIRTSDLPDQRLSFRGGALFHSMGIFRILLKPVLNPLILIGSEQSPQEHPSLLFPRGQKILKLSPGSQHDAGKLHRIHAENGSDCFIHRSFSGDL